MTPVTCCEDICSELHIEGVDGKSKKDIANLINTSLLEPMQEYQPLNCLPPTEDDSEIRLRLSVLEVYQALSSLNPRKASGPDGVPNWLLKEYVVFVTEPICTILNSSFAKQKLPSSWKDADVTPLLKVKPVTAIAKHIRPVSLTSAMSKLAEDFVVRSYVGPAILNIIDPNQFGAIPKSSTTQALISMVHTFAKATDGTGSAIRVVLLDYKKAFDLKDHHILVDKITSLPIPRGIARWVCDFLLNRRQRIKLSRD